MDSEHLKNQIGANIAAARKSCGMTQAELAERIGYSDKAVSKWERSESIPDVLTLVEMAQVFGVTVDALVGEKEPVVQPGQPRRRRVKTGVLFLSSLLVWLVAMLADVVLSSIGIPHSWLAFLYAVPVNAIVLLSLRSAFGRTNWNLILISVIMWGCLVSLYVSLLVFVGVNVWKLAFLGVIGQVAIMMWFRMLLRPKEENHG